MHPYQDYLEKLEKEHRKSAEEVIRQVYIDRNEGPSVTARELGISRQAVLYFIKEYDLRAEKHRKAEEISKFQ